jgi:hypothetical protein
MAHVKKVYARLLSPSRCGCEGTEAKFKLDYLLLYGAGIRSGQIEVAVQEVTNSLRNNLRTALVAHLNARYAPDVFHKHDIEGI